MLWIPAGFLWVGFVTWQLYVWYAAPLGAPALSIAHVVGLRCLVAALAQRLPKNAKSKQYWQRTALYHASFGVLLLAGSVARLFMV